MKRHIRLTAIILFTPIILLAQDAKTSFTNACLVFTNAISGNSNFHMAYDLTVIDNSPASNSSTKHTDVYKGDNGFKLKIGDDQEILYTPGRMLVVNSSIKLIHYSEDSTTTTSQMANSFFSSFLSLIDSANTVTVEKQNGNTTYTLSFGASYAYQYAKFTFNNVGIPTSINCRINQSTPGQIYYKMNVLYTVCDKKKKLCGIFECSLKPTCHQRGLFKI